MTTRLCALVLACLWLLAGTVAGQSRLVPPKQQFRLFLLVGQSNMAGRGEVSPAD